MKLKMNNIHKFYGEGESRIEVLRGINCEINDGELCVLLGPSGSGKSTLLNIIGGIESADEGCIDIGDDCTSNMTEKALTLYRRNHLGFVFQFYMSFYIVFKISEKKIFILKYILKEENGMRIF